MKHIIRMPDGTEITSGGGTVNAIERTLFSESVNSGTELFPGAMCSAFFEASIIAPGGAVQIQEGAELQIIKENEQAEQETVGLFTTQKPTRISANMYRVEAYDRMIWLDRDISAFIEGLTEWPYTLYNLASSILMECGLELVNETIPNGDYPVRKFSITGMTARQLMQKIGEACCRFGKITADGRFEFSWYQETGTTLYSRNILKNSLSYEDYKVRAVENVRLQQTADDVGVSFPGGNEEANTLSIVGNFLLTADTPDDLAPVAETIYNEISWISYTPCRFSTWYPSGIKAGDVVTISDRNGNFFSTCVMESSRTRARQDLASFGSPTRADTAVVNKQAIGSALFGKILELRKSIEGLKVAAKDLENDLSTELDLVADGLSLVVSKVDGIGTYYRFDADGQYIGRPDDEIILKLAAGVIDVLVAGYAAATFDRTGMTAPQATINTLNIGDYTLTVSRDGFLNLS